MFYPTHEEADVIVKLKRVEDLLAPDFPKEWEGMIGL